MPVRAKVKGWMREKTGNNLFVARRPGRSVYFYITNGAIKQCDSKGIPSTAFISPFSDEDRERLLAAAKLMSMGGG